MGKFKAAVVTMVMTMLVCPAHNGCAGVLTYRDVLLDSINYSASLRVKSEDINISNAQYRSNYAGMYPAINLTGSAERYENLDNRNEGNLYSINNEVVGGSSSAWRSGFYLSGQYYLSYWYKKRHEVGYYEKIRDSSVHQCEVELKKIIKDVTEIFGAIVEGKIKLQYSDKILNRLSKIYTVKKEAFRAGQFSYEDVLKAEADTVDSEKEITKIRKELTEYLERMSNFTGKRYSISDTEIVYLPITGLPSIISEKSGIEGMPEYQARRKELEAVKKKEKANANNYLPDASFYARYDFYGSSPDALDCALNDVRQSAYNVGLMISIPIFDGGVKKWRHRQSLYEIKKQEESIRQVINEKNRDLKILRSCYAEVFKSFNHYKKLNDQYRKMIEISNKALSLGERSRLDVMELEKDALAVERDCKIMEHSVAVYEKQIALELDYKNYVSEYNGDWACKY
ncbi:MAG: TolC family protein [Smithellaceae bacterium]